MTFTLKPLPYVYTALEPFLDETTMKIHHDKHHQTYVDKLNAALINHPDLQKRTVEELLKQLNTLPESARQGTRNFGGGVWNHDFYWSIMKKGVTPQGELLKAIEKKWGTLNAFKEAFSTTAASLFGSGWTWLVLEHGELQIVNTSNQDCPLSSGAQPLLTLDVWEHAYYLKFQNRRADFIKEWWSVVNWDAAEQQFKKNST
jgi:Fe-Mn family superoxide dismutase